MLQPVIIIMNAQFSSIILLPIVIQVHDHRILAAIIVPKLVLVLFIKTSLLIQGVMKFIAGNAGVAGLVQVCYKTIH